MLSSVPGRRRRPSLSPGLALALALTLAGCSVEGAMTPPGEVPAMAVIEPVILREPEAPSIPDSYGAPAQDVLAYPVSAGVDMSEVTSALPEGDVTQPVVTGIGTETPRLAAAPDFGQPEAVEAPPSATIGPARQSPTEPVREREKKPGLLAGLLPRFSNPMSKPQWAGGMPVAEKACRTRLKRLGVTYRDVPAINNGPGCSIPYPVEVTQLSGGIEIKPAAKLNCQITDAFAQWVKKELAPAARLRYVSGVQSINQLSAYSCRTMNSKRGAPMSEHATGNAIDVGKITLNNGRAIPVRQPGFFSFREKSLLTSIRTGSCKYFNTVLGPGSDANHKEHFHFDLRARKSNGRYCD